MTGPPPNQLMSKHNLTLKSNDIDKTQPELKSSDIDKSDISTKTVPSSVGVKILSQLAERCTVGNLTIFGVSTDNEKSDYCISGLE